MSFQKTVSCRIILADGQQVRGELNISNRQEFERYLSKKKICKKSEMVDEIIFESMVLKDVRKRETI